MTVKAARKTSSSQFSLTYENPTNEVNHSSNWHGYTELSWENPFYGCLGI